MRVPSIALKHRCIFPFLSLLLLLVAINKDSHTASHNGQKDQSSYAEFRLPTEDRHAWEGSVCAYLGSKRHGSKIIYFRWRLKQTVLSDSSPQVALSKLAGTATSGTRISHSFYMSCMLIRCTTIASTSERLTANDRHISDNSKKLIYWWRCRKTDLGSRVLSNLRNNALNPSESTSENTSILLSTVTVILFLFASHVADYLLVAGGIRTSFLFDFSFSEISIPMRAISLLNEVLNFFRSSSLSLSLSVSAPRDAEWRVIASSVRKVFNGTITYAANWVRCVCAVSSFLGFFLFFVSFLASSEFYALMDSLLYALILSSAFSLALPPSLLPSFSLSLPLSLYFLGWWGGE